MTDRRRSTSRARIGMVGAVFGGAFVVLVTYLWLLMVHDQEVWERRSNENRWAFRSVPSQRGVLRDRLGRELAADEPTTRLTVHYEKFRRDHPVGAAVHAATAWARTREGREGMTYDYLDGVLGPVAAAEELLAVPARELRSRALSKEVVAELSYTATTVLAHCSGLSRQRVFTALREAARDGSGRAVGDVLPVPRYELLASFRRAYAGLQQLDRDVIAQRTAREEAARAAIVQPALLETLELLRRASLTGQRVTWKNEKGKVVEGSKLESVPRTFAEHVPFDFAAELRVSGSANPGIRVQPAVTRSLSVPATAAMRVLLGRVIEVDRAVDQAGRWLDAYVDRELPEDWVEEIVPEGVLETEDARERWQQDARNRYEGELRRRERRGTSGIEKEFDGELTGRLGFRFAERDSRLRERRLWSHLRVEPGEDVRLSIDVDLQHVAERAVATAVERQAALHETEVKRAKVEGALAVIDAGTGDVLAFAGLPLRSGYAHDVPGLVWHGNGAIGSVVKPFVLVEQLHSEREGRPHTPLGSFAPCERRFQHRGRVLLCDHHHGDGGRDPVEALADSCNVFFFQAGIGLGEAGLQRALKRFGLLASDTEDPFAACWQPVVRGFGVARPRMFMNDVLPRRAIGYAVTASPLHLARAYAALATGALPELGLTTEPRTRVPLDDAIGEIGVAQEGLRACVLNGTARRLPVLRDLGVHGKTGTAEVDDDSRENNAWFAGYAPVAASGMQLTFCAVVYFVRHGEHGAEVAGELVSDFLATVQADSALNERYLAGGGGR